MTTALLIIDHGSRRQEANDMVMEVVQQLRRKCPDMLIHGAHMELATPTIEDGVKACVDRGATHLIAHPYMLAPGRHATTDIPKMVRAALAPYPHVSHKITPPLGIDEAMMSLILKRAELL